MTTSTLFGKKVPKIPHLVTSGKGGVAGEVADVRNDVESAMVDLESHGGRLYCEEFTNLAAADTDAFKTSFATSASPQTILPAALDGVIGDDELIPPRNVTITSSTHANVTAVAVVITGKVRDKYGNLIAQTDTITTTNGGGATDAGTKAFSKIDGSVEIPAMGGTAGALQIGFGVLVGLSKKIRSAAGLHMVLQQITDGAVVTNGTFATTAPNGTWSPNTAANGAHDYAILYVTDPA